MKEVKVKRGRSELLVAFGKIPNVARKIVSIGIYLPPKLKANKRREALGCLKDAIGQVKNDFRDPYIILAGDTNKQQIREGIEDYPDMRMVDIGATRGDAKLDILATIIEEEEITTEIRAPLETESGLRSDHNVVLVSMELGRSDAFSKKTFLARKRTKTSNKEMRKWLSDKDWRFLDDIEDVDQKTEAFVSEIEGKMNELYPFKKITAKSTDPPWMTPLIKRRIKSRKKTYRREERGTRWRVRKKETAKLVREAKKKFYNRYVDLAKKSNDPGLYYRAVHSLKEKEAPKPFSVTDLFQGKSDKEVAELSADFSQR